MQTFSAQTELQDCRCTPYNPPSLIVYRIRKIEQQLDNLTRCPVLTKHLLFLLGGEKQTAINWECAINSYGNKVSKYLIIAYVCKYLLTRFAWRICKRVQARHSNRSINLDIKYFWLREVYFIIMVWFGFPEIQAIHHINSLNVLLAWIHKHYDSLWSIFLLASSKWTCLAFSRVEITRGGTEGHTSLSKRAMLFSTLLVVICEDHQTEKNSL